MQESIQFKEALETLLKSVDSMYFFLDKVLRCLPGDTILVKADGLEEGATGEVTAQVISVTFLVGDVHYKFSAEVNGKSKEYTLSLQDFDNAFVSTIQHGPEDSDSPVSK